jgi:hypothetical protein
MYRAHAIPLGMDCVLAMGRLVEESGLLGEAMKG